MIMRLIKFGLPVLALVLFGVAVYHVVTSREKLQPAGHAPPAQPPTSPFPKAVAGAGLIEARSENIAIGTEVPGVVVEVLVQEGDKVSAGDPLFRLDDRELRAQLALKQAALEVAQAQLTRLQELPRPEEIPGLEAKVRAAENELANKVKIRERILKLQGTDAVTQEDIDAAVYSAAIAAANLSQAQADLELLQAGAWKYDKLVAQMNVEQATAEVEQTNTDIQRRTIKALVDGEVLKVNIHPGEFAGTPPTAPLIVLGNTQQLHVRVDIDEEDIPRFRSSAPAVATLRGHAEPRFPLTFERVQPYVIPKQSLTGEATERIDTRVLQVIYRIDAQGKPLYVGQQLDVFIAVEGSDASQPGSN